MRRGLRTIATAFLATRLALLVTGWLAAHLLASGLTLQKGNLVYHAPGPPLLEIWARWDSEWYLLIAERGYGADEAFLGRPVAYRRGDDSGFFPLYPLLVRLVARAGLPSLAAGVLVSNLMLLLAAALLHDLARRESDDETAGRAVWLLLSFPTSFFLSAVYAESTLLAATFLALWLLRSGRPASAGLSAAAAALARPTGVLVLLPLLVDAWGDARAGAPAAPADVERAGARPEGGGTRRGLARAARTAALVLPTAAALGLWSLFCRSLYGEWLPFVTRQERWRGAMSGPWRAFARFFEAPQIHGAHHSAIDFACAAALVLSIPWMWRRLRRSDAAYGSAAILLPLTSTLWSFTRFAAVIYPVPLLLARWARTSERTAALLALMLPIGGLFMALFAAWWWVG